MKYWACINNKVLGPFEADKLAAVPDFTLSTLLCPETAAGGGAGAWKEASSCPEVMAALNPAPAPAQPRRPAPESPLAMTMRGTLIEETPAADPVPQPRRPAAESPLAMTMRGSLIEEPVISAPAALPPGPAPEKAAPTGPASMNPAPAAARLPEPEPLALKLDQLGAKLAAITENQAQLLNRMSRVESAVAEMKALLFPPPPTR
ncbi:MAG TPA: hypothetical protein DEQ38_06570 [Elusimicrobia bacterium]|nr:MAG: hypothetical protein A2089_09035 [Elusimicrobia bacterium GWD2_63_28]HCC47766.1 hypothetical protein [Elusimicrobiota bacterium]